MRGHIANRLQAALWQEAFHLVKTGVASVADVDAAIAHGPGLRWSLLGPFSTCISRAVKGGSARCSRAALAGDRGSCGGISASAMLPEPLKQQVVTGTDQELAHTDLEKLVRQRDEILVQLLQLKAASASLLERRGSDRAKSQFRSKSNRSRS